MSTEKTDAIVLKLSPWSETSAVVTFLTRDFGRISTLAKGAMRLKSPFESALDLLTHSRIVFIAKSADVLDLLTEAKLERRFRSCQTDLTRLNCGFYVAELLLAMTEPGQTLPELFAWTDLTLKSLDAGLPPAELILRFELQALRLLGHLPSFAECVQCGEGIEIHPTIPFSISRGGVLCDGCVEGHGMVFRLREQTIMAMIEYSHDDLLSQSDLESGREMDALPILPKESRAEVRGCLSRYFTYLLDRKLKLHRLLQDLAR